MTTENTETTETKETPKRALRELRIERDEALAELEAYKPVYTETEARRKAWLGDIDARWREAYEPIYAKYSALSDKLAKAKSAVEAALVGVFWERKDKSQRSFGFGLSVRAPEVFDYEESKAIEYAKVEYPLLVIESIDRDGFDTHLRTLQARGKKLPDFVTSATANPTPVVGKWDPSKDSEEKEDA